MIVYAIEYCTVITTDIHFTWKYVQNVLLSEKKIKIAYDPSHNKLYAGYLCA